MDRIKWVDDNLENIINFNNGVLISQADNKLLFIAFCFEYNRWLECCNNKDVSYFITYLPIQLDATCNGFQHLSLLSLNAKLAKQLNLDKSFWYDEPKDFYSYLSVALVYYLKRELGDKKLTPEKRNSYIRLSEITMARSIVKKAIMTIPYNVGIQNMADYIN